MARIRSIKPEFWTAEQVMELSRDARLMFIGLWNFCDDAGIHPASTKTLKAEVFPADDITSADVRRMIDECLEQGLVAEYEVDGRTYWQITGWHHQKIDQPTYKHPTPDGIIPAGAAKRRSEKPASPRNSPDKSPNTSRTFAEQSPNTSRTFAECSPPEWSGVESTGGEVNNLSEVTYSESEPPSADSPPDHATQRKGELCKRLRPLNIDAMPHLQCWDALLTHTDDEILFAAQSAKARKPNERIALAYLVPILADKGSTPKPKPREAAWWATESGILAKGREVGIEARIGESMPEFKARINAKIETAHGATA